MEIILLLLFIALPGLIVFIDFVGLLFKGKQIVPNLIFRITEICSLIILPIMYGGFGEKNDCCSDFSTAFSPEHQLTIEVIAVLSLIAYFHSSYRKTIATPVFEILVNVFLIIGIVLNIFIAIHTNALWLAFGGNLPIILLAIMVLVKNQRAFIEYSQNLEFSTKNKFENVAWKMLNLHPIYKFPVILILCLPVMIIVTSILLLVGQKPDSIVRAFTETYKHGFSQWDYKCDNVDCGGHYLCSVAANGHKAIVKPQRLGIRNDHYIICNRQLLVSNAFFLTLKV